MSIFEAEIRRRTGDEDLLTSKVFGTLNILDRQIILASFLKSIGVSLKEEEIPSLKMKLWSTYTDTEPDVIIESTEQLIFLEIKLDSPVSHEQLVREYKRGKKAKSTFSLFLITKDSQLPPAINYAQEQLSSEFPDVRISWIRWQQIYSIIKEIRNTDGIDAVSCSLLSEILRLLEAKRLRGFMGIKAEWMKKVVASQEHLSSLYDEMAILVQDLNNRVIQYDIAPFTIGGSASNIDRDGRGVSLGEPSGWVTTFIDFTYKDVKWPVTTFSHRHLFVSFHLDEEDIFVGFVIACNKGIPQQDILDTQPRLFKKLQEDPLIEASLIPFSYKSREEWTTIDTSTALDVEKLSKFLWLELQYKVPITDLKDTSGLEKVLKLLVTLRNLINEVGLQPKAGTKMEVEPEGGADAK